MNQSVTILIDEFGNSDLDTSKAGSTSHFVYSGILILNQDLELFRQKHHEISLQYGGGGVLKSSNLGNKDKDFERRLKILRSVLELNFLIFTFVVDKNRLNSQGLEFQSVFYKYFMKVFIRQIAEKYEQITIRADKLGTDRYRQSLNTFISEKVIPRDLFHQNRNFQMLEDPSEEPLLQIADLISGSLGKVYCASHIHRRASEIFDLLAGRLHVDFFPYPKVSYYGKATEQNLTEIDSVILQTSLNQAADLLSQGNLDPAAHTILNHLYILSRSNQDKLTYTEELIRKVKAITLDQNYDTRKLREEIRKLRDKGALISSPKGKSGYKLVTCQEDLIHFFNRYADTIIPMLRRVHIANRLIQQESTGQINILSDNHFDLLSRLVKEATLR
ncbi:MAG: DUF3800 domain-containing protein [Microscillaceae bacterium]|nr:DUF3800 domain-containing protein [Microscillaceae bacterium]